MKNIFLTLFFLISCTNPLVRFSKGEQLFIDEFLFKKKEVAVGDHIVFVLNKSACEPCEKVVKEFYMQPFGNIKKVFVVGSERSPEPDELNNFVYFDYKRLAKYGVTKVNGLVLLFKEGKCVLLESIDIQNITYLNRKINKMLKQ